MISIDSNTINEIYIGNNVIKKAYVGDQLVYLKQQNGVYIQGVSGELYTAEEWANQETPNGVAVITSEHSFVIANVDGKELYVGEEGEEVLYTGVMATTDQSIAITDLNGYNNTQQIINQYDDLYTPGYDAPYYCSGYIFPNGKNGYMGACGEWKIIANNKDQINACRVAIGANKLDKRIGMSYDFKTSTQYNITQMWCVGMGTLHASNPEYNDDTGMLHHASKAHDFTGLVIPLTTL